MSGIGSTVDNGGRRRWLLRLLAVCVLLAAFVTQRRLASDHETSAEEGADGHDATSAAGAGSSSGPATRTARGVRAVQLPAISPGALRLEGLIVDQDDRPVTGAKVTLGGTRVVVTEADGAFAFDGLAEGEYDVTAEHGALFADSQDVRLDDTSDPVTIQLVRGPTLLLHVTDGHAAPIAGAKIEIVSRSYLTDEAGTVRIRGAAMDDERVTITAAGHATFRQRIDTGDDPAVTIEKTIALASGAEITGTVVDHDGKLVGGAYVEVAPASGGRSESTFADDAGVRHLPDVGRGHYVGRASSPVHIATEDLPLEHDGVHPMSSVVLHVEAGGEISGIVVDTAGHPVPEARVTGGSIGETTDKSGRFVARGLAPDGYDLSVSTPMLGAINQHVTLARGAHLEVKIVLSPSSLAGTVVDAKGNPIEEASVFARSEDPDGYGYGRTDERGHFDLGGLPPGHYKIQAQREDSRVEGPTIVVATGNRQVRLMVYETAGLTGRVLLDGKPVPYYGFAVADSPTDIYSRPTSVRDEDGRFTMKDPQLGTFAVVIVGNGFARRVVENVHITSGQVTDLGDITVDHGESVRGRVVDERGAPVPGATVAVRSSHGSSDPGLVGIMRGEVTAQADDRGYYELSGLPEASDERQIEASHPTRGTSGPRPLPAGTTTFELVIAATGAIDGTILNGKRDVSYVHARGTDEASNFYSADVDDDGAFPPGEYRVSIGGHSVVPSKIVTVMANASTPVRFTMPEHPVDLQVHARGCEMISLRTRTEDELILLETCKDDRVTFSGIAPGAYQVCPEMTECRDIEVSTAPQLVELRP